MITVLQFLFRNILADGFSVKPWRSGDIYTDGKERESTLDRRSVVTEMSVSGEWRCKIWYKEKMKKVFWEEGINLGKNEWVGRWRTDRNWDNATFRREGKEKEDEDNVIWRKEVMSSQFNLVLWWSSTDVHTQKLRNLNFYFSSTWIDRSLETKHTGPI